ncbi:putative transporterc [Vanrija pseudolonga]|uniref:Purtative transporterc n=1 Tax=Vanrija pseudolonga TaxID=143232 RepID=A0AAF0YDZ0_9TREE|nr:purtative transporterc [Vanrija pseudolonga]
MATNEKDGKSPLDVTSVPSHEEATISTPPNEKDRAPINPLLEQYLNMNPAEKAAFDKKLLRRIDWHLIPWMTILYLMSFLDRVNIGTAKLWIFFVSYVAFEIPSNLVLKKLRPSRYIPATVIIWSLFQIFMGLVTNYGQLVALRFCLGAAEAGLFPGLNFYLNGWYRREELAKRTSIFFGGAVLAGAFGGIFGWALGHMEGIGGKAGWAWIFIIEGLITFVCGVLSFWLIYDWPDRARFLTDMEREVVHYRLKADSGLGTQGKFSWKTIRRGFTDWKTWVFMLNYLGPAQCIYSQSMFAPSIVASLGTWTRPQSLLLSVPPYIIAFGTTLGTAWLSDKWLKRGIFNMFWGTLAVVGYVILMVTHNAGAKYFAVFFTTLAIAPMISNTIVWTGNNFGSHYKKAVAMGMVFSAGNSGGIWAALAYRSKDAKPTNGQVPYLPGHATAMAFAAANVITSVILWFFMRRENQRREREYGPAPGPDEQHNIDDPAYRAKWGLEGMSRDDILNLGDDHPAFRFIL